MGLVQAVSGAVGGMLGDQWKDFYTVPDGLPSTAALALAAVPRGTNAGRGQRRTVPPTSSPTARRSSYLKVTACCCSRTARSPVSAAEPGGYEWRSDDVNSQSIFAGDGIVGPLIKQSWERFKFGGQPGLQQAALYR